MCGVTTLLGNSFGRSSLKINFLEFLWPKLFQWIAWLETCAGGRQQRGRSFNRRFVLLSVAHFHAKSLTSEHLLLLNAFFSIKGRESCGAGRAHFEERGPGKYPPSSRGAAVTARGPAQTCWKKWVSCLVSRSPSQEETPLHGLHCFWAARIPRRKTRWCELCLLLPGCRAEPSRAEPGWESFWTCQPRGPSPPRAEVRAPAGGPRRVGGRGRGGCGAEARLGGDAAGGDRRRGPGAHGCGARAPRGPGHGGGRGSRRRGARARSRARAGAWGGRWSVRGVLPALDRRDGHPGELPGEAEARGGRVAGPGSRQHPRRPGAPFALADSTSPPLGVVLLRL